MASTAAGANTGTPGGSGTAVNPATWRDRLRAKMKKRRPPAEQIEPKPTPHTPQTATGKQIDLEPWESYESTEKPCTYADKLRARLKRKRTGSI